MTINGFNRYTATVLFTTILLTYSPSTAGMIAAVLAPKPGYRCWCSYTTCQLSSKHTFCVWTREQGGSSAILLDGLAPRFLRLLQTLQKVQRAKATCEESQGALQTSHARYRMERVALDVLGPLPTTGRGNRYTLAVSYFFTKWPEAFAIGNHKAPTVARKLVDEWLTRYAAMQNLH